MTAKPVGMEAAVRRIETLLAEQEHVFVAIDGPCASGKTTLSRNLNERFGGNVLHMDDFFLRSVRLSGLVKVLVAQLAGRVVLTVATAIAVFAFGSTNAIAATWTSDLAAGLPGLAL